MAVPVVLAGIGGQRRRGQHRQPASGSRGSGAAMPLAVRSAVPGGIHAAIPPPRAASPSSADRNRVSRCSSIGTWARSASSSRRSPSARMKKSASYLPCGRQQGGPDGAARGRLGDVVAHQALQEGHAVLAAELDHRPSGQGRQSCHDRGDWALAPHPARRLGTPVGPSAATMVHVPASKPHAVPTPLLVYRDRIGAPSEIQFLRRQYVGLHPADAGLGRAARHAAGGRRSAARVVRLGGDGAAGWLRAPLFRQFGRRAAGSPSAATARCCTHSSPAAARWHCRWRGRSACGWWSRCMAATSARRRTGAARCRRGAGRPSSRRRRASSASRPRWPRWRRARTACRATSSSVLPIGVEVPRRRRRQPSAPPCHLFVGRFVAEEGHRRAGRRRPPPARGRRRHPGASASATGRNARRWRPWRATPAASN